MRVAQIVSPDFTLKVIVEDEPDIVWKRLGLDASLYQILQIFEPYPF